jgi:hypothetical protein
MGDYLLVGQILRSPLTPYEVSTLAVNTRSLHQPYQEKSMKLLELGFSWASIWYPIRAPWSESLSLNNEVNNCPFVRPSVSFVPLQIIMRTLFKLIFCTFCYDISFKC